MPEVTPGTVSEFTTGVRVSIRDGGMSAVVVIPAASPREAITAECLIDALREAEVAVTDRALTTISRTIAKLPPAGQIVEAVLARGRPAENGDDGRIEWLVASKLDEVPDNDDPVDHYERGSLLLVSSGDAIAKVIEPTPGVDGYDVFGKTIEARSGQPANIQHDETIGRKADRLVAQISGMLHRQRGRAHISEVMELSRGVNFETGNIDYKGDVAIRGEVLDRFEVKATGDVDVRGLIEAARVETGGNLLVERGVTGFPDGWLDVGGDLIARFLNRARGVVKGDLKIEREVLDCDLTIEGDLDLSRAVVTGGELRFGKRAEIGELGRPNGVQTILRITYGSSFDLLITRRVYPGVEIVYGSKTYAFYDQVSGPLRIRCNPEGTVVYAIADGASRPLGSLGGVRIEA